MKEKYFEDIEQKDRNTHQKRIEFEEFINDLEIGPIELTSFYARKLSKMKPLENENFKVLIEYAKIRINKEEWDRAYYYLSFIFFDAFRDSKNKEKNKFRNQIIDLMNIYTEKMRIEN